MPTERSRYLLHIHTRAYRAKLKGEEDKVAQALAKMAQEDLTIKVVNDGENRQTLLYGMGDQHLDIIASQLLTKYKVDMTLAEAEGSVPRDDPQEAPM